jgi:hypothetical protein
MAITSTSSRIAQSILLIDSDAKVDIRGDDINTCEIRWLEGTSEISRSDISDKLTELINAEPMNELRIQRNLILEESDWMAGSDVTMSSAWKTYRQALRDMPSNNTNPTWDGDYGSTLGNVTWPTKPS